MKNLFSLKKLTKTTLMALVASCFLINGYAMANEEESAGTGLTFSGVGPLINFGNANQGPTWGSSYSLLSGSTSSLGYGSGLFLESSSVSDPYSFSLDSSFSYASLNDPFYLWSSSFSDEDLLSFGKSDCRKSCASDKWNCGWGPVTDEYLKDQLARCGFEYNYDEKIEPETISEKVTVQCTIGGVVESADTTLDSLKDLIGYDCASLAKLGDAHYCTCVLNKAGNPKDLFYTPLSGKEADTIESLITLNEYQEDVRALKNSLGSVGQILADAHHSDNEALKKLVDNDEEGKVCRAGGPRQLSDFLTTKRDDLDGKSICGGRGTATLNRINNLNKLEDEAHASASSGGGSSDDPIDVSEIDDGSGFHEDMNEAQVEYLEEEYGYEEATANKIRDGVDLDIIARRACRGAALHLIQQKHQQAPVPGNGSGVCRPNAGDTVSPTYSVSQQLNFIMRKYRKEGKGDPAAFVASMKSEAKGRRMLEKLKRAVSGKYKIIDKGIFKHHAYQPSAMEMMIETLDSVIPPGTDILSPTKEAELVNAVDKGMSSLEERVVKEALGRCKQFVKNQVNLCQELDKRGTDDEVKKEISVGDYKDFKPERSLFYAKIPKYLGSLKEFDDEALFRKFSQYRCAKIMGDDKLAGKAFQKEEPSDGKDDEKEEITGIDAITAWEEESSSADLSGTSGASVYNPYGAEEEIRNKVFAKSKSAELRDWARSVRESSNSGSSGSLIGASSSENVTKGNLGFSDTNESVSQIAEATRQAFGTDQTNNNNESSTLLPSNYTESVKAMSDRDRKREEEKAEKEKDNAEQRLEVIAQRLADIMGQQKSNEAKIDEKKKGKSDDELAKDPEYEKMLIEKLELEREIARLNREKLETQRKREKAKAQIAEIDSVNNGTSSTGRSIASTDSLGGGPDASKKGSTTAGKTSSGKSRSKSSGLGSGISGSGGGGGGSFAPSNDSQNFFANAPYVITLTQDQVTAIKDKFQVVDNPNNWKPGGKPPVIRDGNIYYELAVKDGKIVVDALGRPVKKKALNGFNVEGQRKPASTISELSKDVDKAEVLIERAKRVKELNDVLDGANE